MDGRAMDRAGLGLAAISAAAFATSGSFAASLLEAGWTPGAAVTIRVVLAALLLTYPATRTLRRAGGAGALRRGSPMLITYGVSAVAGTQLCYFLAIQRLPVAIALLLEYSAVLMVVAWMWLRHGQRPGKLTIAGAATAIAGLVIVLDVIGQATIDPIGVMWGLIAAVGLATYFVLSASQDDELPPLAVAWGGLLVGGAVLSAAALVGLLEMAAPRRDVVLLGNETSWLVPVIGLAVIAGAVAFVTGIGGARRLGARVASFVGLAEVLFAVVFAWVLVGQSLRPAQIAGAVLVIAGIVLVRLGEPRGMSSDDEVRNISEANPLVPATETR